jgi:thymidylate synthase
MPEVSSPSITEVWKQAVAIANGSSHREASPLIATVTDITNGVPQEDIQFRRRLDQSLLANDRASVETVAGTIFPQSLWNPGNPRDRLFGRYIRAYPRIRRHPKNRRGTYFQRMIAYPRDAADTFNQLDQVISTYLAGNHRRSALQANVIVPWLDLNDARQLGFPCMHQVAFLPNGDQGTLHVVGFYPMQYLYERAYGNYLGLIRLGHFMAHEMGLDLKTMSCASIVAKVEVSQQMIAALLVNPQ